MKREKLINNPVFPRSRTRVNVSEQAALQAIVEFERLSSVSEALRLCIRESARTRGLWPPTTSPHQEAVNE